MAATFSRTLHALRADRTRPRLLELLGGGLVLAWASWFLLGEVAVYEVTEKARLEVERAAHPVTTAVAGQVVQTRLAIGLPVQEGDVLVVLDAEAERRALHEKQTRRDALTARLQATSREIQAEEDALATDRQARVVALEEARTAIKKAEALNRFNTTQLEMVATLQQRNAAAKLELAKARAEADVSRVGIRSATLAAQRLEQERMLQEKDRLTRLAKLKREKVEQEEEQRVEEAAVHRLEHEIARRSIQAPVAGRVGEVIEFPVGSTVRAAEKLGAIVPPGAPRAVAWFPAAVVGRLHPGQPARLRLTGFPWTQYGTMPATVAGVGNEASGGRVRVELRLASAQPPSIPLEHGLPGSAEVEVERISPALLVFRAAGQFLGTTHSGGAGDQGEP